MTPELKRQRIKSIVEQSLVTEPNYRMRYVVALLAAFAAGGLVASFL